MSDTHILIGKRLRYGVEQAGSGSYEVDLSDFTVHEIRHPIVTAMLAEFRPLYTFKLNEARRAVTVAWRPIAQDAAQQAVPHGLTARITNRRR